MKESDREPTGPEIRIEERLTARIARIERTNRRLRWTVRGLVGATAVLLALVSLPLVESRWTGRVETAPTGDEIRTRRVVLEDAAGTARGLWEIDDEGAARLTILDGGGRGRLNLAVRGDGAPGMSFTDGEERRRVVLGLLPDQTSTLVFADEGGVARAVLGLSGNRSASLVFADSRGVGRVGLGLDGSGAGNFMLPESEVEPAGDGEDARDRP